MAKNLSIYLTDFAVEEIRKNLRIGQKVKTNKVPWSSGQGKSDYEHKTSVGKMKGF